MVMDEQDLQDVSATGCRNETGSRAANNAYGEFSAQTEKEGPVNDGPYVSGVRL